MSILLIKCIWPAAGAVLGHDFTFEELCQVAQLAPQDGLVSLDEALQSLLLCVSSHRWAGREEVSYHSGHDKIRQVVYAAAGDARRRVFHGRAYDPGARAHSRRGAGLPRARQILRFGGITLRMSKKKYCSG